MDNENLRNVLYPICPVNMYFEGDEDKCDVTHCNFSTETRSCTEACKIDVKNLQKELDKIEPAKGTLIAMRKNLGLGHRGDILLTTQTRINNNLEPIAKDIVDENYAMTLARRWNAFEKDGLVDELTKVTELLENAEKARSRGLFNTKYTVEACLSEVCGFVTRALALTHVIKYNLKHGETERG